MDNFSTGASHQALKRDVKAAQAFEVFSPSDLSGEAPPRCWIVEGWVPLSVTGMYGDGGIGKSLLLQQLQTSIALGLDWLGLPTIQCKSLGIYCEDDREEIQRRQEALNRQFDCTNDDLDFLMSCRPGRDNQLFRFSKEPRTTPLFQEICDDAVRSGVRLVVIDSLAEIFTGNENDRTEVHQFVSRVFRKLANEINGAVIFCAHPSRAGLSSKKGDAGSTAWHNAVRSRIYLERKNSVLQMSLKKSNYGQSGQRLDLRWNDGCFQSTTVAKRRTSSMDAIEAAFMELLDRNQNFSSRPRSGNYAPKIFSDLNPTHSCEEYRRAMDSLLAKRQIVDEEYGNKVPRSRRLRIAKS